MTILGIFGDLVEYTYNGDSEINYCSVEDFIEEFGREELFGDEIDIIDFPDGTLYVC